MARSSRPRSKPTKIDVTILIPAQDEAGNLSALIPEILTALDGEKLEIVVIDDASRDQTAGVVGNLQKSHPEIRLIRNQTAAGKSGALWIGAKSARGEFGITVDGDGQNDPKYLQPMLELLRSDEQVGLVAGQRQRRGDGTFKLIASRIANGARSRLLGDRTWDTACGLKAFRMTAFRALPYFETLHRFLPALMAADGWRVRHLDVVDRPREFGQSKYGILDRLAVGIPDLFGVWWLTRRRRRHAGVKSSLEGQNSRRAD
ncbi:MAG: glycosyltransferase family 2 protein [Fimbriimonadaceae bacterium]|nr:glycosyltransferase family 2 protein [Alphaproteobacteria bacterium]